MTSLLHNKDAYWSRYYIILSLLCSTYHFGIWGSVKFTGWIKFLIIKPVETEEAGMSNLLLIWYLIKSKAGANSVAFNSSGRLITLKGGARSHKGLQALFDFPGVVAKNNVPMVCVFFLLSIIMEA